MRAPRGASGLLNAVGGDGLDEIAIKPRRLRARSSSWPHPVSATLSSRKKLFSSCGPGREAIESPADGDIAIVDLQGNIAPVPE